MYKIVIRIALRFSKHYFTALYTLLLPQDKAGKSNFLLIYIILLMLNTTLVDVILTAR